jgi:hypothetical protein
VTPCYYGHRVPWFDEDFVGMGAPAASHRLYRLFEFLDTPSRAAGMTPGTRVPAKVNINNIWDPEVLLALVDPQGANANAFGPDDVMNTIWPKLMATRSPSGAPAQFDRPFWTLAAGRYPAADTQFLRASDASGTALSDTDGNPIPFGINNTLLRTANSTDPPDALHLFQTNTKAASQIHPYMQDQLLSKLFNNVTTRSNVFAVWVTVGFFEVIDDTSRPVKFGAEIGKTENRHIRHRMFAIVDRSSLTVEKNNTSLVGPPPVYLPMTQIPPNYTPAANTFIVSGVNGNYDGTPWEIRQNTNVLVDTGPNQEIVTVLAAPTVMATPPATLPNLQGITLTGPAVQKAPVPAPVFYKPHSFPVSITPISTLTVASPVSPSGPPAAPSIGPGPNIQLTLNGTSLKGIQPGTWVVVDIGPLTGGVAETVQVQSVTPYNALLNQSPTITVNLNNGHYNLATNPLTISYPIPAQGNPGPQPSFNLRQVPWVVRYFSIIN